MTYKIVAKWKNDISEVVDETEDETEAKYLVYEYHQIFCVGIQGSKCEAVFYIEE